MKSDGEFLSEEDFWKVSEFENGIAAVFLNNKYNYLRLDGTLLFEEWRENPLPIIRNCEKI